MLVELVHHITVWLVMHVAHHQFLPLVLKDRYACSVCNYVTCILDNEVGPDQEWGEGRGVFWGFEHRSHSDRTVLHVYHYYLWQVSGF